MHETVRTRRNWVAETTLIFFEDNLALSLSCLLRIEHPVYIEFGRKRYQYLSNQCPAVYFFQRVAGPTQ
jgi:hypothetical protein